MTHSIAFEGFLDHLALLPGRLPAREARFEHRDAPAWLGGVPPDADAVRARLTADLGPLWTGLDGLSPMRRTLVVFLASFADRVPTHADLLRLAADLEGKGHDVDMDAARSRCDEAASRHAYESTVLRSMMAGSASARALPSWVAAGIRDKDRDLYVQLCDASMGAGLPEGLAVRFHHRLELQAGAPVAEPRFDLLAETLAAKLVGEA